jgi:hypothetical protein
MRTPGSAPEEEHYSGPPRPTSDLTVLAESTEDDRAPEAEPTMRLGYRGDS